METTLSSQQEQLQKETQDYKDAIEKKKKEELELDNVLKQYKDRYQEFNQGLKQSRKAILQQEKEVNIMNRTIQQLEETKRLTLLANSPHAQQVLNDLAQEQQQNQPQGKAKGKNKKKKAGQQNNITKEKEDELVKQLEQENKNMEDDIEQMKADWETQKKELMQTKDLLSQKCQMIQEQIKSKKTKEWAVLYA